MTQDLFANLETSLGTIRVRLFADKAPKTVENFVALAKGSKEYTDPQDGKKKNEPYYNGTIFHRVIPRFMIQAGDRSGTGMGGPGYRFADEFHPELKHDRPGVLSMANAGPNTNGSQFFITTVPTPHLDRRHSVFGEVVAGYDVVEAISNVSRDGRDRPREDVVLKSVTIEG
jgi:peptidyl-prolyl cis-trans isomerase A (cyclophilin A)